ncbi:uncharacterized protein N7483_000033 [Penicillium malachiteum]|uniref:uncharacterized protein n=1 Tax=Penicillium malachiteum TaxID=1324776 RepID=UPI00254783AF|nr:uncharacterized protein N7483_000033 [Penicillium malachiteum]KAJ5734908.1 hypothetical protein N7483_000033 [Penicillium malachiteum]
MAESAVKIIKGGLGKYALVVLDGLIKHVLSAFESDSSDQDKVSIEIAKRYIKAENCKNMDWKVHAEWDR